MLDKPSEEEFENRLENIPVDDILSIGIQLNNDRLIKYAARKFKKYKEIYKEDIEEVLKENINDLMHIGKNEIIEKLLKSGFPEALDIEDLKAYKDAAKKFGYEEAMKLFDIAMHKYFPYQI